ncbi:MAG: hypothetical protein AAGE01_13545 [Pseudomonadota bacterium]
MTSSARFSIASAILLACATGALGKPQIYTLAGNERAYSLEYRAEFTPQFGSNAMTRSPNGDIYFNDGGVILRIDAETGIVGRFAGDPNSFVTSLPGPLGEATFATIRALDWRNERLYVIAGDEFSGSVVAVIDTRRGTADFVRVGLFTDVAADDDGTIYLSSQMDHIIARIEPETGDASLVAGTFGIPGFEEDGTLLNAPGRLVLVDETLYFTDSGNNRVREIDLSTGAVSTVLGTGLPAVDFFDDQNLSFPFALGFTPSGDLVVSDSAPDFFDPFFLRPRLLVRDLNRGLSFPFLDASGFGLFGDAPTIDLLVRERDVLTFPPERGAIIQNRLDFFTLTTDTELFTGANAGRNCTESIRFTAFGSVSSIAALEDTVYVSTGSVRSLDRVLGIVNVVDSRPADLIALHPEANALFVVTPLLLDVIDPPLILRELNPETGESTDVAGDFDADDLFADPEVLEAPALSTSINPTALAVRADGRVLLGQDGLILELDDGILRRIAGGGSGPLDGSPATDAALGEIRAIVESPSGDVYFANAASGSPLTPIFRIDGDTGIIEYVTGAGFLGLAPISDGVSLDLLTLENVVHLHFREDGALLVGDAGANRVGLLRLEDGLVELLAGGGEQPPADGLDGPMVALDFISMGVDRAGTIFLGSNAIFDGQRGGILALVPEGADAPATATGLAAREGLFAVSSPGTNTMHIYRNSGCRIEREASVPLPPIAAARARVASSVSARGTSVAVGLDGPGAGKGDGAVPEAALLQRGPDGWEFRALVGEGRDGDAPPVSVILANDRLLVGDPVANDAAPGSGAVRSYRFDDDRLVLESTLLHPEPAANQRFGAALALDGEQLAVSAPGTGQGSGSVFLYDRLAQFDLVATVTESAPTGSFGEALALRNDQLLVGIPLDSTPGSVELIDLRDGGSDPVRLQVRPNGATPSFGSAVAWARGDEFKVGAPTESGGAVYTYTFIDGVVGNTAVELAGEGQAGFGASLVAAGDFELIGAPESVGGQGLVQIRRDTLRLFRGGFEGGLPVLAEDLR